MKTRFFIITILAASALGIAAFGSYEVWNATDPNTTCASCHEVKSAVDCWGKSAHAKIACTQCHSTALSGGFKTLTEKLGMAVSHFTKEIDKISIPESGLTEISQRCANCHANEHAKWLTGAHSTTYKNIFADDYHNSWEKPYGDCFRCHGMFYDGSIKKLMDLDCSKPFIKDEKQKYVHAIPCMACHQVHSPKDAIAPKNFLSKNSPIPQASTPKTAFYSRAEKTYLRTDKLARIKMYLDGRELKTSDDPNQMLCMQCHSPDWRKTARSQDDRTPTGPHEGLSCLACHDPHSNDASKSCAKCHTPAEKYKFKSGKCPL